MKFKVKLRFNNSHITIEVLTIKVQKPEGKILKYTYLRKKKNDY